MAKIKFAVTDDQYEAICAAAEEMHMTVQDYVRSKVLDSDMAPENDGELFTPVAAVDLAYSKYSVGDMFTLPDLYGDKWKMPRGAAGVFGRQFFSYVMSAHQGMIEYVDQANGGRHARYRITSKERVDVEGKFTPKEAVRRAMKLMDVGETFTLRSVYGEEWEIPAVEARIFGKRFYAYVAEMHPGMIEYVEGGADGAVAIYKLVSKIRTDLLTPSEAVTRIYDKYEIGDKFTLREVFGDDWDIPMVEAMAFGKRFYSYVIEAHPGMITCLGGGTGGKSAIYQLFGDKRTDE